MLKKFRVYVSLMPEVTDAKHYISVDELILEFFTERGTIESAQMEAYSYLKSRYPDRELKSIEVYRA
jgi:hypothetical protein